MADRCAPLAEVAPDFSVVSFWWDTEVIRPDGGLVWFPFITVTAGRGTRSVMVPRRTAAVGKGIRQSALGVLKALWTGHG